MRDKPRRLRGRVICTNLNWKGFIPLGLILHGAEPLE